MAFFEPAILLVFQPFNRRKNHAFTHAIKQKISQNGLAHAQAMATVFWQFISYAALTSGKPNPHSTETAPNAFNRRACLEHAHRTASTPALYR